MNFIPPLALLLSVILIYVPRMVVARIQSKQPEGYDNAHPRAQQAKLTGLGARAQGAHQNGFEAFAPFAAAVLICEVRHVDTARLATLSMAFVAARFLYLGLYLANLPTIRSLVWLAGFAITVALFVSAIGV